MHDVLLVVGIITDKQGVQQFKAGSFKIRFASGYHIINDAEHQYNHERVHESLNNMTPAGVYYGRAREIQTMRNMVKKYTLQ